MSIIKNSNIIRQAIIDRMKEQNYTPAFICNDAEERGFTIKSPHLTSYMKGRATSSLSEKQVIYVATRLGIYVSVLIGKPTINKENEPVYEVPEYNELEAIKNVNKLLKSLNSETASETKKVKKTK